MLFGRAGKSNLLLGERCSESYIFVLDIGCDQNGVGTGPNLGDNLAKVPRRGGVKGKLPGEESNPRLRHNVLGIMWG